MMLRNPSSQVPLSWTPVDSLLHDIYTAKLIHQMATDSVYATESGSLHTAQRLRWKKATELAHHTAQQLSWKKVAESGSHTDSSGTQLEEGS